MNDPLPGTLVGSWRIVREIGRGRTARVYEAEHPGIGSRVAIKVLDAALVFDEDAVRRFFTEARTVNLIAHDGIARIPDLGRFSDGRPYLVMEFVDGTTLAALPRPIPLERLGPIALQLADALQAAHRRGVIHRDLKPESVLLLESGRRRDLVKIVDFGLAKLLRGAQASAGTPHHLGLGTAHYLPPEQALGDGARLGPGSDVYALGAMLFHLATGRPPYEGASVIDVIAAHVKAPPPSARALVAELPARFDALLQRCLAKEPGDRFASMRALGDELVSILESEGLARELPPRLAPAPTTPRPDPEGTVPTPAIVAPTLRLAAATLLAPKRESPRKQGAIAIISFLLVLVPGLALLFARRCG